jgi:hypothetical protein
MLAWHPFKAEKVAKAKAKANKERNQRSAWSAPKAGQATVTEEARRVTGNDRESCFDFRNVR